MSKLRGKNRNRENQRHNKRLHDYDQVLACERANEYDRACKAADQIEAKRKYNIDDEASSIAGGFSLER